MPSLFFFLPIELGREQSSRTNHSSAYAVLNSIADIYQYAWQVYKHACLFPQEVFHRCMHECTMLCVSTREYSRADMPTLAFIIMVAKCSRRGNVNWKLNIIHLDAGLDAALLLNRLYVNFWRLILVWRLIFMRVRKRSSHQSVIEKIEFSFFLLSRRIATLVLKQLFFYRLF